jgi:hypothetical protein
MNARPAITLPPDFVENYPGHAKELIARLEREYDVAAASAAPLPGALREAYAGEPRTVQGLTLQPVNAWLLAILTRLESPLLDIIAIYRANAARFTAAGLAEEKALIEKEIQAEVERIKVPPEKIIETVFAFTTPVEQCQDLLDAGTFRKQALLTLGKKLHPSQLAQLERAIGEHFAASYATALEFQAPPDPSGGTVFTPPPAPTTASAGGSKSSAP